MNSRIIAPATANTPEMRPAPVPAETASCQSLPTIILATHSSYKIKEFQALMPDYQIIPMREVGFSGNIQEPGDTFVANAIIKAETILRYLQERFPDNQYIVVAEDSGICVNALNGRPGAYTARYGGENCSGTKQRAKLLEEMRDITDRRAHFQCCIVCYLPNGLHFMVSGHTSGFITESERGENGFAFDKIFESIELDKTFGEATPAEKNSVSHRARAITQLRANIKELS